VLFSIVASLLLDNPAPHVVVVVTYTFVYVFVTTIFSLITSERIIQPFVTDMPFCD